MRRRMAIQRGRRRTPRRDVNDLRWFRTRTSLGIMREIKRPILVLRWSSPSNHRMPLFGKCPFASPYLFTKDGRNVLQSQMAIPGISGGLDGRASLPGAETPGSSLLVDASRKKYTDSTPVRDH